MKNRKIGFIGLGIMGKPMAKNLIKDGYSLVVHDLNREPVAELKDEGAEVAFSSKEVAEKCSVIITILPNSPEVKEVILGSEGVLEGAKEGLIIIDMSSIAPLVSKELFKKCQEKGVRLMDAPVSGGEPGAVAGTLSIMVGGDKSDFELCYDMLKSMGDSVVRVGNIGSGNTVKLANQIIVAINIAAMSEALVLGAKAGVDLELLYNAIRGGLAGSKVLDAKVPLVMKNKFDPGFKINLHTKDLSNVLETSHQIGVPLPLTSLVMEIFQSLKADGKGELDHGGVISFYKKMACME